MGIPRDMTLTLTSPQEAIPSLQSKYDSLWTSFIREIDKKHFFHCLLYKVFLFCEKHDISDIQNGDFSLEELKFLKELEDQSKKDRIGMNEVENQYTISVPTQLENLIIKRFNIDFKSEFGALTLDPWEVRGDKVGVGEYGKSIFKKTHADDGWTIEGVVSEDYYEWVNYFRASHTELGKVWGDFESTVYASSEEGFKDFYSKHTPTAWDYQDI